MAKLYFYYAAMNAGKTTDLLRSSYNYQERGMATLLYTLAIDTRYGVGKIASRIGIQAEAIPITSTFDFLQDVQQHHAMKPVQCVLVDEAHFITKEQVLQLTRIVDILNIPVLAYGLRSDFLGETFPGSQYLLAWADTLQELKTICFCGQKATMNARMDSEGKRVRQGEQVDIGGNEKYTALCRKHFELG